MIRRQFGVLYRDFLFRVVDRELLSTHAKGDASQLLLQIVTLLAFVSIALSIPALIVDFTGPVQARVMAAWSLEHFLIATTMLAVGVLAVLSWGAMFPDHRDVLVLAPLPIRARTILVAKLVAVITALGVTIGALHLVAGLVWPMVFNSRVHAATMLALTSDAPTAPVRVTGLQPVLDRDLEWAMRHGRLAAGARGGLAIGVYQQGERRIVIYGAATPTSLFQIGSVTKPFTGLVLAEMVETHQVSLNQPVRQLIPDAHLARPAGPEITLLDLATHHAGLPSMPQDYRPIDPMNPYAAFHVENLYAFLAHHGLAGQATPSPPVGPSLGQHGVNIMEFCKAFNAQTQAQAGMITPVVVTVYSDRSFSFITKSPPASALLKQAAGIVKGTGTPSREKVGKVTPEQVRQIAETKMADLNAITIEAAMRIIAGTARSMGIEITN